MIRVQGIGYRLSTWEVANKLEIKGWVHNLPNAIEAVFEATREIVEDIMQSCLQAKALSVIKDIVVDYKTLEVIPEFERRR